MFCVLCGHCPCCVSQVWDANTFQLLATLEGHGDNVRVLAVGERHLFR